MSDTNDTPSIPRENALRQDARLPDDSSELAPRSVCRAFRSVKLFDVNINSLTLEEVFEAIDRQIEERRCGFVVTPNVDHICQLQHDTAFQDVYKRAFLAIPDSTPLMWASWLLRKPLREKVSGSDLIYLLSEHAAKHNYRVFFLGGIDQSVAEDTAERLRTLYPGLVVAGVYSPPFAFEKDSVEVARIEETLRAAAPDICFTALGAPKQDYWNSRVSELCAIPVMLGVGAAFDFVTGRKRRAPLFLQKSGLEWAWRLCLEPRRLWKRYLVRDTQFFRLLWLEYWSGAFGKRKNR